jgi:hypothetical protein
VRRGFHRIEALTEVGGRMKVLDMKIDAVCDSVLSPSRPVTSIVHHRHRLAPKQ